MNRSIAVLVCLLILMAARWAAADIIHLKNGRAIQADKAWVEGDQVHYTKFDAVIKYPADQVARIERTPAPAEATPSPGPAPEPAAKAGAAPAAETAAPIAPAPAPVRPRQPEPDDGGVMASVKSFFTPDPAARKGRSSRDPMTIQSLIKRLEYVDPMILIGAFAAPPLLVWLMGIFIGQDRARRNPWRYLYSLFVYLVSVPGMLSCVLIAYGLFFLRQNLLQVNVFVYYLPILSMIFTLVLIGRKVSWRFLPGVDRLYAVMIALIITFGGILAIQKTRIFVVFFGSVKFLIIIAVVCFILLKWAARKAFGRR